jgi:predicted lysophospholipase L1 biosynthesis ABC-type transport system permease subunit
MKQYQFVTISALLALICSAVVAVPAYRAYQDSRPTFNEPLQPIGPRLLGQM